MSSYHVQCDLIVLGKRCPFWALRDQSDDGYETTILDIATAQLENVRRVVEVDLEDGVARDVSEDFALEIISRLDDVPRSQGLIDFLEEHAAEAYREFAREKEAA